MFIFVLLVLHEYLIVAFYESIVHKKKCRLKFNEEKSKATLTPNSFIDTSFSINSDSQRVLCPSFRVGELQINIFQTVSGNTAPGYTKLFPVTKKKFVKNK